VGTSGDWTDYGITRWTHYCRESFEYLKFLLSPTVQRFVFVQNYNPEGQNFPNIRLSNVRYPNPYVLQAFKASQSQYAHQGVAPPDGATAPLLDKLWPGWITGSTSTDSLLSQLQSAWSRWNPKLDTSNNPVPCVDS
jgi:hypothetical protein